jgi:hypothetical protein
MVLAKDTTRFCGSERTDVPSERLGRWLRGGVLPSDAHSSSEPRSERRTGFGPSGFLGYCQSRARSLLSFLLSYLTNHTEPV